MTMNNNEDKNLMIQKAMNGYTVCFNEQCPMHVQCLRWLVGQQMPSNVKECTCINPLYEGVATDLCPMYRSTQKVRWAKGMTNIFTDDMPQKVEKAVRRALEGRYNRTYFFEYRNGTRLIHPDMQEEIRNLFRQNGWTEEVQFDEFVDAYQW